MKDWNGIEIECAQSIGGVVATAHPFDNLIRTGCNPWPPPEIVQKLYQSIHSKSFSGNDLEICTSGLGYYCDLQSLHSEDAITWSVFGTISRARGQVRSAWLLDLLECLELQDIQTDEVEIFLWRRIPHPDTGGLGGPEIDVGICTSNIVILGEAKWLSGTGSGQGKRKDKDQIQLRGEFLLKYGTKVFQNCSQFIVLGIGLLPESFVDTTPERIDFKSATWEQVCSIIPHPLADEVLRYFEWKKANSKIAGRL